MDFTNLYAAMQQKASKKLNYEEILNTVIGILVKSLNTIHEAPDAYKSLNVKRICHNNVTATEFHCDNKFILGVILRDNGDLMVDLNPEDKNVNPIDVKVEDRTPIIKAVEQIIDGLDSDHFEDVKGIFDKENDNKDIIVKIINTLEKVPYTSKFDNLHVYGIDNHFGFFEGKNFIMSLIFKHDDVICCTNITSRIGDGVKLTGVTKALAEKVRTIIESQKGSNDSIKLLSENEARKAAVAMLADILGHKLFE